MLDPGIGTGVYLGCEKRCLVMVNWCVERGLYVIEFLLAVILFVFTQVEEVVAGSVAFV
jgi:hypothetical protein